MDSSDSALKGASQVASSGASSSLEAQAAPVAAAARQLGLQRVDEKMLKLITDMLHPSSLPEGWRATWDAKNDRWCVGTSRFAHYCTGLFLKLT